MRAGTVAVGLLLVIVALVVWQRGGWHLPSAHITQAHYDTEGWYYRGEFIPPYPISTIPQSDIDNHVALTITKQDLVLELYPDKLSWQSGIELSIARWVEGGDVTNPNAGDPVVTHTATTKVPDGKEVGSYLIVPLQADDGVYVILDPFTSTSDDLWGVIVQYQP